MTNDEQLLHAYARERLESAFNELVARHIDFVYSAALRVVNGDSHLAQDVTQTVFIDLARKAGSLPRGVVLTGWLHRHTWYTAATAVRTERRRQSREQRAMEMRALDDNTRPEWELVAPYLDESLNQLNPADRDALVLRFLKQQDLRAVGEALGVSDDAAQKRVDRALEKLHVLLKRRGSTLSAAALGTALATEAVTAAPTGLSGSVAATALASAAAASTGAAALSAAVLRQVVSSKLHLVFGCGAAALFVLVTALLVISRQTARDRSKVAAAVPALPSASTASVSNTELQTGALQTASTPAQLTNGSVLHLQIVAADSGKPVPLVVISLEGSTPSDWQGEWLQEKKLTANRFGVCDLAYPSNIGQLELSTQTEGFADTRLLWRPDRGEVIPTSYVLRLDRATPIGGRVLDPDGNPVAGAQVVWHLGDDPGGVEKVPESHEFAWIKTATDEKGQWRIERIAEDMLRRLEGYARHTNRVYLDPDYVRLSWNPRAEKELRDGTHAFKMGRTVTVTGIAVDSAGAPIGDAKVRVGRRYHGGTCEGKTEADGTFSIGGCEPGLQTVCAEAAGYAATSVVAELSAADQPVRLVLHPGPTLRMRVVDKAGGPVAGANVFQEVDDNVPNHPGPSKPFLVNFHGATDREGRLAWTNAPAGELRFGINAPGFIQAWLVRIPADGQEHVVTLASMSVIQGTVRDQSNGQLLPRFRIGVGYPELFNGTTNAAWANLDRFWKEFSNGTYRYSCDEPLQRSLDGENLGWILKFEAPGYASQVSRIIRADEGAIQLDVALRPAANTIVTVFKPDGRPAAHADVGLFFPGSRLQLVAGGLSREAGPGGSHMATDKKGTFELRPDGSIDRVLVVCADGYAEATPAVLVAQPVMQMQPWGRLEVTGMAAGPPETSYSFEFGNQILLGTHYGRFEERSKTNAPGVRVFSKLPPGHHKLAAWPRGVETPFEIRSGETTTLNLSASSATNTAPSVPAP